MRNLRKSALVGLIAGLVVGIILSILVIIFLYFLGPSPWAMWSKPLVPLSSFEKILRAAAVATLVIVLSSGFGVLFGVIFGAIRDKIRGRRQE